MKKAVIIDDEPLAIDFLEKQIAKDGRLQVVQKFLDSKQALSYCLMHPDVIVFLDIEMPDLNGILFGKRLKTLHPNITLIYVTAYSSYALDAFDVYASGYLLKPVIYEKLTMLLDNVLINKSSNIQSPVSNTLKVNTLGILSFSCNNKDVSFRTKRAQELFSYLLSNNGNYVDSDKIVRDIWALEYSDDIAKTLNTNIYYCEQALAPFNLRDIIVCSNNSYCVNMQMIEWDYLEAIKIMEDSETVFKTSQQIHQIDEYINGKCHDTINYEWAKNLDNTLKAKFNHFYQVQIGNPDLNSDDYEILVCIKNRLNN